MKLEMEMIFPGRSGLAGDVEDVSVEAAEPECPPLREAATATCFCLLQSGAARQMGRASKKGQTPRTGCFWIFSHLSRFLSSCFSPALCLHNAGGTWKPCDPRDDLSRHFSTHHPPSSPQLK